jgi:glutamate-1-semialdehyde 2,1-aminomutase
VIGGGLPVGAFGGRAEIMDHLAPLGPVYQAGTLSGNPLAMAAGLAQLEVLEKENGFEKLEVLGRRFEDGMRGLLRRRKLDFSFYRSGSMFCLFLTGKTVVNLDDAKTADLPRFARMFHALLDGGVYIAPSHFETGFLSLAHEPADLDKTLEVWEAALNA